MSDEPKFSLVEYEDAKVFGTEGNFSLSECAAKVYGKPHNDVLKKIRELEKAYIQVIGGEGKFSQTSYVDDQNRALLMGSDLSLSLTLTVGSGKGLCFCFRVSIHIWIQ